MGKTQIEKSPLSGNLHHVGMIVHDMDKTIEYYESLGIGPFESIEGVPIEIKIWGKSVDRLNLKAKFAHVYPTRIELLQPVGEESSIWKDWLDRHGDGIHHVAYVVEDMDKAKAELVKRGLKVVLEVKSGDGARATYLTADGPTLFELFKRPTNYVPRERR